MQLLQESLVSGDFVRRGGTIRRNGLNGTASEELVPILRYARRVGQSATLRSLTSYIVSS